MKLYETYDLQQILLNLEVVLQVDGANYGEHSIDKVMDNIYTRIDSAYNLDLRGRLITDDELYVGPTRSSAIMFMDNVKSYHSELCGYFQIVRYTKHIDIRPQHVNFFGYSQQSFMRFTKEATHKSNMKNLESTIEAFSESFDSIAMTLEKRFMLLMIVSYKLGFYELFATIVEIFRLGGMA